MPKRHYELWNENVSEIKFYFSFRLRVLKISSALDEPGTVNWDVALCLLLAWIICYLCVFKGVKSTGKARELCVRFPIVRATLLR